MAWRACGLVILYLLSQFPKHSMAAIFNDSINVGFSASNMRFVDDEGLFLRSQNSAFVIGLLNIDRRNNYYLCIKHMSSHVVVWTANRNFPVSNSDEFALSLNGEAALVAGNNVKVWSSGTAGFGVKKMQLQDSGNLVLLNGANKTIWQSFDHPTDTLLAGQIFRQGMKLVSSSSSSNISSGQYSLSMQSENLLLLIGFNPPQAYWTLAKDARAVRLSSGKPSFARLDQTGLSLVDNDSTVVLQVTFTDGMASTLRRAWLSPDGNFQLLSFVAGMWSYHFTAIENECGLPLSCGPYGICSSSGQCSCPGFLRPLNASDLSHGCQGPASPCSAMSHAQFQQIGTGLEYFANPFSTPEITSGIPACQQRCQQNCSCVSFFYYQESNLCFLFSQLGTLQQSGNKNYSAYIKLYGLSQSELSRPQKSSSTPKFLLPLIIGGAGLVIISMISYFAFWLHRTNLKSSSNEEPQDDEIGLEYTAGLPTRFSYKELEIATNRFSKRLGSGGFGSVYEGTLPDRSKVAVKQLEGIGQGRKEFRAEVAIIGSIHHVHLVRLRGFCAEGAHRLLVYEYMANGSLDKCLFYSKDSNFLDWSRRYNIAIGTAKGLAYLHDDCREKIVHCDIKPENILLNESYHAKVSDFGLAKLINKEQSQVFTTLRGTRGYLAPEWLMNLRLSEKSDVYSFGMVLLEIVSGRKNFDPSETSEKWYFPAYAFQQAEHGRLEDLVDMKLKETAIVEQVVRAVRVALWCIQEEATIRPSMGKVVQMLEGNIEVQDPPLTSLLAVRLHARMVEAMCMEDQKASSTSDYNNTQGMLSAIQLSEPR